MAKFWCIRCQAEREHFYAYGQACCEGGNCEHRCLTCRMNTLAYIQPNTNESQGEMIKQMVGEAQRKAIRTGERGDVEVSRTVVNSSGEYYCQILVYNTHTGNYRTN